jgi:hypothetical protein
MAKARDVVNGMEGADADALEEILDELEEDPDDDIDLSGAAGVGATKTTPAPSYLGSTTAGRARQAVKAALAGMDDSLRRTITYQEGDFPGALVNDMVDRAGPDVIESLKDVSFGRYPWMKNYMLGFAAALQVLYPLTQSPQVDALPGKSRNQILVAADILTGALQYGISFVEGDYDEAVRAQMCLTRNRGLMGSERARKLHKNSVAMAKVAGSYPRADASGLGKQAPRGRIHPHEVADALAKMDGAGPITPRTAKG